MISVFSFVYSSSHHALHTPGVIVSAKPTYEDLEERVQKLERTVRDLGEDEQRYRTIFERNRNPIVDAGGSTVGVVLVFRDITEKIKLETELRQAHKMEAIGNLAGGIAHEFNNVLGIILGNAELALADLEEWHPVSENLNEIRMASLRAKDVVKQLLAFSRKMDTRREPVDVRIIVKETLKLPRAAIPSYIRIREVIPPEVDPLDADPTQIHQLLINLCNNAAQAMSEDGGRLTIELSNVDLDFEAASKHPDLQPGAHVRFSVFDTGCGIPADLLDRVFDPYFTTKEVGKGTGMGLAVVHGIVKAHPRGHPRGKPCRPRDGLSRLLPVQPGEGSSHGSRAGNAPGRERENPPRGRRTGHRVVVRQGPPSARVFRGLEHGPPRGQGAFRSGSLRVRSRDLGHGDAPHDGGSAGTGAHPHPSRRARHPLHGVQREDFSGEGRGPGDPGVGPQAHPEK